MKQLQKLFHKRRRMIIYHDNVKTAETTAQKIELIDNPTYSPDLAPTVKKTNYVVGDCQRQKDRLMHLKVIF